MPQSPAISAPGSVAQLLAAMVRIPTVNSAVSGDAAAEAPLVQYNERLAQSLGFRTRRLPVAGRAPNLLVSFEVDTAGPWVLFESHMDTVSTAGMSIDPEGAQVRAGRLYGRGACDTKGSGAAMLWALGAYAQGRDRPNNVAILFTIDEEVQMSGVRSFIENDFPVLGFRPAGVIVGEPTGLRAITAHNGVVRWAIQTEGIAAHSSTPARGVSAISKMVKVVEAIESRYIPALDRAHPLTGRAQCSINLIRGGTQINIVPSQCRIELDRRIVPGEDPDAVLPHVQSILDDLRARDPDLKVKQELSFTAPPLAPPGSPPGSGRLLGAAVQGVLRGLGLEDEPAGATYATDAGDLARLGVPVVVLGPGDIAQAHTHDEWIALDQLDQGVDVYRALMQSPIAHGDSGVPSNAG